jgi:catechol 2,3-dioxygenase-like lactoylglutathione lyase family enzyme
MRITGLHHVTLISRDLQKTTAFYRDVLGLGLVEEGRNDDDPDARHFWFGDADGSAGSLLSFMEYPAMEPGRAGPGMGHHFALTVDSDEELDAWRDYLQVQGVQTTEVFHRGRFRSLYLRDPDGHILELATRV